MGSQRIRKNRSMYRSGLVRRNGRRRRCWAARPSGPEGPFHPRKNHIAGRGPLDVHDLGFLAFAHLFHTPDLVIGELLHLVECSLFFIL